MSATPTPTHTSEFMGLLVKSGLMEDAGVEALGELPDEPSVCAAYLVGKGVLTKFQARQLLSGRYKGMKLGAYVIRDQIGSGGMGAVFLAEHETLRRKVALKVLTLPKDGNARLSIERFLREARSAAALDHPNIVRLHDTGKQGDTHFLVMEYVEGQTLEQLVAKGGTVSSSRAVDYIAQAAAGLQHASEKGFVHRDIKPSNLMLSRDGTIKILDMGLARPTDQNESNLTEVMDKGAIVGTADFISPEQAMNGQLDVRSDIYSLGATFYAIVTGQPPFTGNTTQKLIQHQMKVAPSVATIDKTFPPGLSAVVAKMLEKKPENRYQNPAEVIKALAEWLPRQAGARVAAAISSTGMAQSSGLSATLSEISSGGTKRIGSNPHMESPKPKRDWLLPAVAGAVLIVAGCIAALITLSRGDTQGNPNAAQETAVAPPDPTPNTPAPKKDPGTAPVSVPSPPGLLLVSLDLRKQQPFTIQGRMVAKAGANTKVWTADSVAGEGSMPKDWTCRSSLLTSVDTVAEFASRSVDGQPALGMRNVITASSTALCAILLSPKIDTPTSRIQIAFECKFEDPGATLALKFLQHKPSPKASFEFLKVNADQSTGWKTIRLDVDLRGATGGLVEFLPSGLDYVWIRNFKILEGGTTAP